MWTTPIYLQDNHVCFEVVSFHNSGEEIKRQATEITDYLDKQLGYVIEEVQQYNANLRSRIQNSFQTRKKKFLDKNNLLASLEVPIKKKENLPSTYSAPIPKKRKQIVFKPAAPSEKYEPEPTLPCSVYQEILQHIHDLGKTFERMPSTYMGKKEEEIRDHILLYLEPRYEGYAGGETFNKQGKTDILIRYENHNIFIAECKFWEGQKAYLDAITQLMGYLTWRDSKAALVIFVRNKDFSSVIQSIEEITNTHPNYLGFINKIDETWLNYRFHINDDRNREVKLAILLFHMP